VTPERLATLCGLLPEWEIEIHDGELLAKAPGDFMPVNTKAQFMADHLLMEALRAVYANEKADQVVLQIMVFGELVSGATTPWWSALIKGEGIEAQGDDDNPLHAILDAVREAGL